MDRVVIGNRLCTFNCQLFVNPRPFSKKLLDGCFCSFVFALVCFEPLDSSSAYVGSFFVLHVCNCSPCLLVPVFGRVPKFYGLAYAGLNSLCVFPCVSFGMMANKNRLP